MRIHYELEWDGGKDDRHFSAYDAIRRAEALVRAGVAAVRIVEVQRVKYHNQARRVVQVFDAR